MKIILITMLSLLAFPVMAQNPEMVIAMKVFECKAINMTLAHVYGQVAASMAALSPNGDAMKPMIDSYQVMARDATAKADEIGILIDTVISPAIAEQNQLPREVVNIGNEQLVIQFVMRMGAVLMDTHVNFDEQTMMLKSLSDESGVCEEIVGAFEKK
jgi:hypothetical protein